MFEHAADAAAAAERMATPVAIKAVATGLLHKSDAGGVRLGLRGADEVLAAAAEIEAAVTRAGHRLDGLVLQPMAPPGVELIVGVVHDHSFGPVLACGAGGTTAELIKDVSVRITPVTDLDASEMVRSLKTFPLLDGYRGAPPCDIAAVEDVLLRVSAMVHRAPGDRGARLQPSDRRARRRDDRRCARPGRRVRTAAAGTVAERLAAHSSRWCVIRSVGAGAGLAGPTSTAGIEGGWEGCAGLSGWW